MTFESRALSPCSSRGRSRRSGSRLSRFLQRKSNAGSRKVLQTWEILAMSLMPRRRLSPSSSLYTSRRMCVSNSVIARARCIRVHDCKGHLNILIKDNRYQVDMMFHSTDRSCQAPRARKRLIKALYVPCWPRSKVSKQVKHWSCCWKHNLGHSSRLWRYTYRNIHMPRREDWCQEPRSVWLEDRRISKSSMRTSTLGIMWWD